MNIYFFIPEVYFCFCLVGMLFVVKGRCGTAPCWCGPSPWLSPGPPPRKCHRRGKPSTKSSMLSPRFDGRGPYVVTLRLSRWMVVLVGEIFPPTLEPGLAGGRWCSSLGLPCWLLYATGCTSELWSQFLYVWEGRFQKRWVDVLPPHVSPCDRVDRWWWFWKTAPHETTQCNWRKC